MDSGLGLQFVDCRCQLDDRVGFLGVGITLSRFPVENRSVYLDDLPVQGKYPLIPTLWMIFEDPTFAFRSGDKHRSRRIYGK